MKEEKKLDNELTLETLYEIPVQVSVVLGKTTIQLNKLLKLNKGAVIELNRHVGELVDVYVNEKLLAKGEIVIVEENKIGVTLIELVDNKEK